MIILQSNIAVEFIGLITFSVIVLFLTLSFLLNKVDNFFKK
mgnify:CR=1 FL=1